MKKTVNGRCVLTDLPRNEKGFCAHCRKAALANSRTWLTRKPCHLRWGSRKPPKSDLSFYDQFAALPDAEKQRYNDAAEKLFGFHKRRAGVPMAFGDATLVAGASVGMFAAEKINT